MKNLYLITAISLQLLLFINLTYGFHFLRLPPQNTSTYVKLKETTLLKWTVQLTKQDLNSKTGVVWVRLEKLINDGNKRNALDSTNYVPITPFRKITDLIRTGNEHVRKIKFDIYEIGFYVTAKQQEDSGYYRAYVKTDDNLDYLSYSYFLKVLVPPKFIDCMRTIEAKTREVGNSRFDETHPQLHIRSSCTAEGYPRPKVYCVLEGSNMLSLVNDDGEFEFEFEWFGTKPTIRCIADGDPAGFVVLRRKDYFIFHKPIAPKELTQLPSSSDTSIRLQWKHLSKDDAGGEIYHYVIYYRALWYGRQESIFLSTPKPSHLTNKDYFIEGDRVYYEIKSLAKSKNYSISIQVWNIQGRRGYITDAIMQSGFHFRPYNTTQAPISSRHLAKSTTMIIATFALAGILIFLLLVAILYRRHKHIRRTRCQCNNHERIREQRDFFNLAGSFASPFVLPSYEEAVRTKPTESPPSFEDLTDEPFQELRLSGQNTSRDDVSLIEEPSGVAPPPYPGSSLSSSPSSPTTITTYVQLHNT